MKPFLPLLALAPLLLLSAPVSATSVVGTGTPASCTEAALEAAILEANGESGLVLFDCGAAPHTLTLTTAKNLGQGVAIDGGGKITLSGNDATRIFSLAQGVAVQIGNITLSRGFASPGGGCILAFSSSGNPSQLVLSGVTFDRCRAGEYGGAIAGNFTILNATDSVFFDNTANTGGGGAVSVNNSNAFFERTRFEHNIAALQGGAIQAWSSELTLEDSTFQDNRATATTDANAGGGAIVLQAAGATVRDSDFFINSSNRHGGALLLLNNSDVTVEDSKFGYNFSTRSGAGIYADGTSVVRLERDSLWGNNAQQYGGAVFSRNFLEVRNATFYLNVASLGGTAIFVEVGSLDMVSSTLVDNVNPASPSSAGQIAWSAGTTIAVHNSLIQAPETGGLACAPSGPATFTNALWHDQSCPAGAGSQLAVLPLFPFGFSCGGASTERTPTVPVYDNQLTDTGSCRPGDPVTDQRGMPRNHGEGCDQGAVEFFEPCDAPMFIDGFESGTTQSWSFSVP
jgi:hypothetical protein